MGPLAEADGDNTLRVTLLLNSGVMHTVLGDLEASARCLEQALAIQEQEFGPEHVELVGTLQNLTVVYSKLGQPSKAATFMQRAGEIEAASKQAVEQPDNEAASAESQEPKIVEVQS